MRRARAAGRLWASQQEQTWSWDGCGAVVLLEAVSRRAAGTCGRTGSLAPRGRGHPAQGTSQCEHKARRVPEPGPLLSPDRTAEPLS